MANPQREDGHLDIANELARRFCSYRLSGQEWLMVWVILHKTWGFVERDCEGNLTKDQSGLIRKKKFDKIPLSQFSKLTGIDRRRCHELLKSLVDKKVVSKRVSNNGNKIIITYGFQKDYDQWKVSPKKVTVINNDEKVSSKKTTNLPPKMTPSKEYKRKLSKENCVFRQKSDLYSDHKRFSQSWSIEYQNRFGMPYKFSWTKEGRIIKSLLDIFGYEKLCRMASLFFVTEDSWIRNTGFTIPVFSGQANQLAQKLSGPTTEAIENKELKKYEKYS